MEWQSVRKKKECNGTFGEAKQIHFFDEIIQSTFFHLRWCILVRWTVATWRNGGKDEEEVSYSIMLMKSMCIKYLPFRSFLLAVTIFFFIFLLSFCMNLFTEIPFPMGAHFTILHLIFHNKFPKCDTLSRNAKNPFPFGIHSLTA